MSGTNYLSLRADAPSNTTSATVGSIGFSTLVGSTLSANTAALASSLSVSSLTTGFLGFSTLVGSSMSTNFITVQSTITASTLTASGNVGIGSVAPVHKLDVNGSASLSGTLYMADEQNLFIGANTNNAIRLHHTSNQTYLDYGSADLNIRSNDGSNVLNDRIIVKQNGSVGIVTTTPNEKLHLNGNLTLGLAGAQAAYYIYPRPTYSSEIGQGNRSGGTLYGNTMDISSGYFQTAAWNGQFYSGVLNLRTGTQNDIGNNGTAGGTYQSGSMYLYTGDVVVRNDGGSTQPCIPGSIYFGTGKVVRNATGSDPGPNPTWRMVINGSTGNVGIGTDNPTTSLHVHATTTATTTGILSSRFYLSGPGDNQDATGTDQDGPWYGLGWSGITGLSGSPYVCLAGWSGVALRSGSGFLQLASTGNVGIGTTNPGGNLTVYGTGVSSFPFINITSDQSSRGLTMLHISSAGSGITGSQLGDGLITVESGTVGDGSKLYLCRNSAFVPSMTVVNTGNVGIGMTNPSYLLDVNGSARIGGVTNNVVLATNTVQITHPTASFVSYNAGYPPDINPIVRNSIAAWYGTRDGVVSRGAAIDFEDVNTNSSYPTAIRGGQIKFYTTSVVQQGVDASLRMTLDVNGNLGIGTATPDYKLKIEQGLSNNSNGLFISNSNYGSMQGLNISMVNAGSGNFNSYAALQGYTSGVSYPTHISLQPSSGNVGIGTTSPSTILHVARAVSANNDYSLMTYYENTYPSYHDWAIGPYIDSGAAAFAVRIASNNVPANLVNLFYIDGYGTGIRFPQYTSGGTLSINGGLISASSDRRIKEDIVYQTDTADGLARVLQLRPATFRMCNQPGTRLGFIAQDVEECIPLAVDGKKYEWKWKPTENGGPTFDADGNIIYETDADGNRIIRPRGLEDRAIIAMQTLAIQQLAKENIALQNHLVSLMTWAKSYGYVPPS